MSVTDFASKVCAGRCRRRLPLDAFHVEKNARDGRRRVCADCTSQDKAVFNVSGDLHRAVKAAAQQRGETITDLVTRACTRELHLLYREVAR